MWLPSSAALVLSELTPLVIHSFINMFVNLIKYLIHPIDSRVITVDVKAYVGCNECNPLSAH